MDEQEFRKHADAALEALRKRLLDLGDEHDFEVEGEGEKLELYFEEPEETRFVISPNTAARQIWISALSTSFKLGWSESAGAFVMGIKHGAYCVGCCWMLMGLLFVFGVMNLLWVAALSGLVLLEKLAPFGRAIARTSGVLMVAGAIALAAYR